MSLRVLIAVTHLLGAGHLTRAAALARAFARGGHETTLVSGGSPARLGEMDRVALVQLPPVRILGTDFRTLLDEAGSPIDGARLDERRGLLVQTLKEVRPDVVVTELFPFGRRVLAGEFTALVQEARRLDPRPLILCSIRDILVAPSKPERVKEAHGRALRDYDAVLVHGDPQLIALEDSWPLDERVRPLIRYTGYVDENEGPVLGGARRGILVSGGSSAAGLPLYRAALAAAEAIPDRPWRILVGRGVTEEDFLSLQSTAPAHATVERARPDFRALLSRAEVSVSQAGYNTVVDLLRAGARPVLVPFEAGHETEQRLRAERLKALGLTTILPEADLSPEALAAAIRQELAHPPLPAHPVSLDGARQSAAVAEGLRLSGPSLHRAIDWSPLDRALGRARDRNRPVAFWWRDDDAVAHTPPLDRLLALARRVEAGLALAVIPTGLEPSLAARLAGEERVLALVHGSSHANHAPPGEKKAEFGRHRPVEAMAQEAERSLHAAKGLLGARLLPVFVPPWNRIAPELTPHLPRLGYGALSAFRDREAAHPAPGLLQVNTHVDPIDWHGTRSLADPGGIVAAMAEAVERRIAGRANRGEPIGFLTHHLVHDEAVWTFCEKLLMYLLDREIRLLAVDGLFHNVNRITVEV
jgi:predicted glycosyltransferase